jgi:putative endonuclease
MALHNELGRKGEELAISYLSKHGFTILFTNWRHQRFEIDVIAVRDDVLHFIEVKTRRTNSYGMPEEAVDKNKLRCMIAAGEEFVQLHSEWKRVQFDVLAISIVNKEVKYFLIEDVYL